RGAVHFFLQGSIGTRTAIDAVTANSARARLGGRAGAGLCARAPLAVRNSADDSSRRRPGQFLGTRLQPHESTGAIFYSARHRVFWTAEFSQRRNSLRR